MAEIGSTGMGKATISRKTIAVIPISSVSSEEKICEEMYKAHERYLREKDGRCEVRQKERKASGSLTVPNRSG